MYILEHPVDRIFRAGGNKVDKVEVFLEYSDHVTAVIKPLISIIIIFFPFLIENISHVFYIILRDTFFKTFFQTSLPSQTTSKSLTLRWTRETLW